MVVFGEIGDVEWPLVIGMLWKMNREDKDEKEYRDEKTKRERDICDEERENENKIIIYIMQLLSVPCQNCDGIVAYCKSLAHLTHLIKGRFWCLVWQMCQIFGIWHICHTCCGCSYSN